ncbi:MAG: hypothetical protein AABZ31_10405 [Bdellovibrionota bacterium]
MNKFLNILFIQTLFFTASFVAATAHADPKDFKIQVVEQNYSFEGSAKIPAQNIKIQIQFAKPTTTSQLENAKTWLRTAEDKYRVAPQYRYTVNVGEQNLTATAPQLIPNGEREEIRIPLSRFQKIRNWVAGITGQVDNVEETQADISAPSKRAAIKKSIDQFIYKFSTDQLRVPLVAGQSLKLNYLPTLAIARASVNGTVISLSFLASDLPHAAAWVTGMTLGAISGAIQYKIKPFSDFLEKKGWMHSWYKKALARYIYVAALASSYRSGLSYDLAKNVAQASEDDFMQLKFTDSALYNANLVTKWWAVEVAILGLADIMFRVAGSPLETSILASVSSVLYTSTLATLGQGTWDFAFIIDKAKREEQLLKDNIDVLDPSHINHAKAQEEHGKGYASIKFNLAIKSFAISVGSNVAAALLLAGDGEATKLVANTLIGTLSGAGALYYGFIQLKYNNALKMKISQAKQKVAQSCSSFLADAFQPPPLLPGINL